MGSRTARDGRRTICSTGGPYRARGPGLPVLAVSYPLKFPKDKKGLRK